MQKRKPQNTPADEAVRDEWRAAIEASDYTVIGLCEKFQMTPCNVRLWLSGSRMRTKNKVKMQGIVDMIKNEPKITRHPSYGYATPEQIKALQEMGLSPERDKVLAQIEKQTKQMGKRK